MNLLARIKRRQFDNELRQKLLDEQQRRARALEEEEHENKQKAIIQISDQADYNTKAADKKLKRKYIIGQIAQMTLTLLCVLGIAALGFFFVHQFGLDYALPKIITYLAGAGISGIIFTGYFFLFTVSAFKANKAAYEKQLREKVEEVKEHRLSKEEQEEHEKKLATEEAKIIKESKFLSYMFRRTRKMKDNARIRVMFDNYIKREAKKSLEGTRKTKFQMIMMTLAMGISTLAILFLGGGNYLGIMDIGKTAGLAVAFQPLAILSGLAMFITFIGYFHADVRKNAADLSRPRKKTKEQTNDNKNETQLDKKEKQNVKTKDNKSIVEQEKEEQEQQNKKQKFSFMAWTIRIGYYFLAIFSAVGFASFKFYSTAHVVEVLGFTNPVIIGLTGATAFLSMMIFSLSTNTVSMWKVGTIQSEKYDVHRELKSARKIAGVNPPASEKRPFLFYVAWAVTFLTAAFNGVGSFIGMYSIAALYPPLLIPLIIIGVLAGISRFAEIMIYYGPVIVENMSGVKVGLDAHKQIEEYQDEIDLIKSQHPEKFGLKNQQNNTANHSAQQTVSVNDPQHDFARDKHSYQGPTSGSDALLGRTRITLKLPMGQLQKLDKAAQSLGMQ